MRPDVEAAVALLKREGYRLTEPKPKEKPPRCVECGAVESDVLYEPQYWDLSDLPDDVVGAAWMTRIKVEVGDSGEEGWDFVVNWYCDDHGDERIAELKKLGYTTHHHGSTHPLADDDTCAYGCEQQGSPYDEDDE